MDAVAEVNGYRSLAFGDVMVMEEAVHTTAGGRRLLVTHGDQFDAVVKYRVRRFRSILAAWRWRVHWPPRRYVAGSTP